jgi:hypothetical protein
VEAAAVETVGSLTSHTTLKREPYGSLFFCALGDADYSSLAFTVEQSVPE